MKKIITTLIIFIGAQTAFSQTHLLPKFIRKMYFDKDTTKKSSFVILPVLSSAPETGLEAGGAGLYSFYTDTVSANTRVSNVFGYATITTKGQNRLSLSTSYWTPQNKYHITAGISYINFPFDFYGIGNNTLKANTDRIGQKRVKVNFGAERKVADNFYVGLVAGGEHYSFSDGQPNSIFYTDQQVQFRQGGTSLYVGPSFIFDSRNNNTYTTRGALISSSLQLIKGISGFDYKGGFFNIEYTQFFSLSKKLVLGIDIQDQSLIGGQSPFFLMPTLGNDEIMRGYYNGRYRDRNMLVGQTELRYRLSERIGVVGFVGTGEVFNKDFSFSELKPNYGGGLRYFFDIEKGLSIRADYGIGQKVAGEARQSGFYVGLGQAF
jgi:hypothetical protein